MRADAAAKRAAKRTAEQITARIAEIVSSVGQFEQIRDAAREAHQFTAAVGAQAKVNALRGEIDQLQRSLRIAQETDPYRRLLMLRDAAIADGSHVAAASHERLAAQERDRMTAAEAERRTRELEGATLDDLAALILPAIQDLPRELALQVAEAVLGRDDIELEDLRVDEEDDA